MQESFDAIVRYVCSNLYSSYVPTGTYMPKTIAVLYRIVK